MAFSVWQSFITDGETIIPSPTIEVRKESDGSLATLYSDPAGSALANPFTGTVEGFAQFFVAGNDTYKITATSGAFSEVLRYEPLGNARQYDVGTDPGDLMTQSDMDSRYAGYHLDNLTAVTAPTVNDDSDDGYSAGSRWFDTASSPPEAYLCLDAAVGEAVWVQTTLTLAELGSMATKNAGTTGAAFQDNDANRAEYMPKDGDETTIAGTSYTTTSADNGTVLRTTNSSAVTITLDLDTDNQIGVIMGGTGEVTIQAQSGDTIESADSIVTITTQYAAAYIWKRDATTYVLLGGIEPVLPDGSAAGDVPVWNGTEWEAGRGLADLGWILVADDVYTTGSRKTINASTRTQLDITYGASSIETYAPRNVVGNGTGGWWDDTGDAFMPSTVGDGYLVRLSFKCDPAGANPYLLIEGSIDEGASPPNVIFSETVTLAQGSGVETQVVRTYSLFALSTFVANGLKFFITPSGNTEFWDMSVLIHRVTDGASDQ